MEVLVVPEATLAEGVDGVRPAVEAPEDLVLARRPDIAPQGALALAAARALGARVVWLPRDPALARWVVCVAAAWSAAGEEDLPSAVGGLVCLLTGAPVLPVRPWGAGETLVPAVPPRMLARLARHAASTCPRPDARAAAAA